MQPPPPPPNILLPQCSLHPAPSPHADLGRRSRSRSASLSSLSLLLCAGVDGVACSGGVVCLPRIRRACTGRGATAGKPRHSRGCDGTHRILLSNAAAAASSCHQQAAFPPLQMYMCIDLCLYSLRFPQYIHTCSAQMSLCVYIYIYMYICLCIYIYIPTHIHTYLCTYMDVGLSRNKTHDAPFAIKNYVAGAACTQSGPVSASCAHAPRHLLLWPCLPTQVASPQTQIGPSHPRRDSLHALLCRGHCAKHRRRPLA